MGIFYAHSVNDTDKTEWQTLADHLSGVAELSGSFARDVDLEQLGMAAGMLHDIGKASPSFQGRLEGASTKVDHSSAGAMIAYDQLRELGYPLAYVVAGHHSGLSNGAKDDMHLSSLRTKLEKRTLLDDVDSDLVSDASGRLAQIKGLMTDELTTFIKRGLSTSDKVAEEQQFQAYLLTKVLYSCLVDADYLDTEKFMSPQLTHARQSPYDSVDELIVKYDTYMQRLSAKAERTELNECRRSVRNQCLAAANGPQGFFTLHVPTGGGKTLSVVGFALLHAKKHGLRRIIIALPYTNLIEQTADIMREVFGAQNVLEHHSNYDFEAVELDRAQHEKLATQNWDAPIIVTTNVQLFESLFSNKPGKSRKVHNVARSVVILDEAQSLPDGMLRPTLAMLEMLVRSCGMSCVLCTATQPYFKDAWPFGESPSEIVTNRAGFNRTFGKRTCFESLGTLEKGDLCERIASEKQVLCIVGNKTEAREIYRELTTFMDGQTAEASCFYLSTNKTPEHRSRNLESIKRLLSENKPCYVVSTQLIEAGVDIDFPVVYRELAGIDSLFQAAGRCNREGTIEKAAPVYVFECRKDDGSLFKSPSWLEKQKKISRTVLCERGGRIDSGAIESYFKLRYSNDDELDANKVLNSICRHQDLESALEMMPFKTIATDYRLISDESLPVFVRWGDGAEGLYRKMQNSFEPATLTRSAQRYSLALRNEVLNELESEGCIEKIPPFTILNACDGCRIVYDEDVGLCLGEEEKLLTLIG